MVASTVTDTYVVSYTPPLSLFTTQARLTQPLYYIGGFLFLARSPTYRKTTLSRPKTFRHQDDIEGIHLRLREADVHIPWVTSGVYVHALPILRALLLRCVIPVERWGRHNRPVTIAAEKQAKLGFPTAAGDRRRLGVTTETRRRRSCGGDSDPGPLSSS